MNKITPSNIWPDYESLHEWEQYYAQLPIEYRQSLEEGLDIAAHEDLFKAISKMANSPQKEKMADILYEIVANCPQVADHKYDEPSDLENIRALRPQFDHQPHVMPDTNTMQDKILGAWLGRTCGCLLGKPIEGIRTNELWPLLKASGNFPLHRYIRKTDISADMYENFNYDLKDKCFADTIAHAPVDDDTNYTVLAHLLLNKYGRGFTPQDVARTWLACQPKDAYCTAERVAFCNLVKGYMPPASAIYKNPYREWIGAQIRADYFGYINPGDPEMAADMAWRDASISHVKNGIYGEMWVAAMLAMAAISDNVMDIIRGGLAQIPANSRLHEAIAALLKDYQNGQDADRCISNIHAAYDENDAHDWCHTIPNALIVAAALLHGGGDFSKSICMAVQAGFDTDCNGATVGSILGMRGGSTCIGPDWTAPLNNCLDTSIFGVGKVNISEMAQATMRHL